MDRSQEWSDAVFRITIRFNLFFFRNRDVKMFRNEDCIGEELNRACLAKTTKTKTGIQYIRADIVTLKRVVKGGLDHVSRKIKRFFHNSRKTKT